jgi:hypothetical protein
VQFSGGVGRAMAWLLLLLIFNSGSSYDRDDRYLAAFGVCAHLYHCAPP